jgi:predicted  nucleic acid-binding Zn-ribbon protein
MGRGMGTGYAPMQDPPAQSPENEMESLKREAKSLRDQLNSILSRIEELEGK